MSVRQNGKTIAGSNKYLPDLFDYKTSDHLLKNPAWLRADTFSWHSGDMYIPAYEQLVAEANNFSDMVQETVNGITIEFTLNENGHKIVNGQDSENVAKVNEIYEQTGRSWYYILDIVNKRFKLPREVMRDKDAKLVESRTSATYWYRLYDDGWVEQGGKVTVGQDSRVNVTLPIPMNSTTYQILITANSSGTIRTGGDGNYSATPTSVSSFDWMNGDDYTITNGWWEVKGYSNRTAKSPKPQYLYFYVGPFAQKEILNDPDIPAILDTKQDKSTAINYSYITNCITYIPQDIKLKLNNGAIILEADSKVYIPNGFESDGTTPHYDTQIISNDITSQVHLSNDSNMPIVYAEGGIHTMMDGNSGTTTPTASSSYQIFYNTAENKCYFDNGAWVQCSLPFGIVNRNDSIGYYSIVHTFNGYGYIGNEIFVLPGLECLIPNERNDDGSLKNIKITNNKVLRITQTHTNRTDIVIFMNSLGELQQWARGESACVIYVQNKIPKPNRPYIRMYTEDENKWYCVADDITAWLPDGIDKTEICELFSVDAYNSTGKITNIKYKTNHHSVDWNEADFVIAYQKPTSSNGWVWYRLYKSGWVEQGGYATAGQYNNGTVINLPITMANANYTVSVSPKSNTHWTDSAMYNRNGNSQIIIYAGFNGGSGQNGEVCWEVKGFAA